MNRKLDVIEQDIKVSEENIDVLEDIKRKVRLINFSSNIMAICAFLAGIGVGLILSRL